MSKSVLSPRQRKFILALLSSTTIKEAAQLAGVHKRTAQRYLHDPLVKAALSSMLDSMFIQATAQAAGEVADALRTLREIHLDKDAPPSPRVSAAKALAVIAPQLRETQSLVDRLAKVEERLESMEVKRDGKE